MAPSLSAMLDACDAAVVIGDTTMRAPADRWPNLDLGEEWHQMTGLPLVFAAWAVKPELAKPNLVDMLTRAKAHGLQSLREISEVEAARLHLPTDACFHYLNEIMDYDLTDRHIEGLRVLGDKAHRHGLVPEPADLKLYEPLADGIVRK